MSYVGILSNEQVSLVGFNVVFEIIGKVSPKNFVTVWNTIDKFCFKFCISHTYGYKCIKRWDKCQTYEVICYGEIRKIGLEGIYQGGLWSFL